MSNLSVWANTLRVTTMNQVTGQLAETDGHGKIVGQCCLGILCACAGVIPDIINSDEVFYEGKTGLPPAKAIQWLGLETPTEHDPADGWSLAVDWPDRSVWDYTDREGDTYDATIATSEYAGLNDDLRLTFPQIADMADYFGARV